MINDDCNGSVYHGATVTIGEMSNGVLTKLYPPPCFRTDFTEVAVQAAREAYRAAKHAADEAYATMYPFGEYDR